MKPSKMTSLLVALAGLVAGAFILGTDVRADDGSKPNKAVSVKVSDLDELENSP